MSERFSLKDLLFNKESVTYLAALFYAKDVSFPKKKFIKNIMGLLPELELKQRISCIRKELEKTLQGNYKESIKTILAVLPPELDPAKTDDDFGKFILAPLAEFVAANGCNKKDLYTSLNALREMTKRFSAEDAIRYFINAFPEETLYFLKEGATSYNYHIRRLSSEGTRPKLPWGIGITTHYKEALPILDILFSDPTRYITRSVANHMNDISKIDPDLVVEKLALWKESGKQNIQEMNFICRHSLRTLVKKGYPEALELLGYPCHPKITIENFKLSTKKVPIGSYLEFSFEIYSLSDQNLMIDYIVHYRSKSGSTSPKVFKIKKTHVKKGERVVITKKQAFKPMTTKKLYPGEHYMELQINGKKLPLSSFVLVEPS